MSLQVLIRHLRGLMAEQTMMSETLINKELNEEFIWAEKEHIYEISKRNAEIERNVLELSRNMVAAQTRANHATERKSKMHYRSIESNFRKQIRFIIGDYEQYKIELLNGAF